MRTRMVPISIAIGLFGTSFAACSHAGFAPGVPGTAGAATAQTARGALSLVRAAERLRALGGVAGSEPRTAERDIR